MHYTNALLPAFAAVATLSQAAPTESFFRITNFYYKHAVESQYANIYFESQLVEPQRDPGPVTRCYTSVKTTEHNGLANIGEHPCELRNTFFLIDQSASNGRWRLEIGEIDTGGNHTFPLGAETTFTANDAFSNKPETYKQLEAPASFKASLFVGG